MSTVTLSIDGTDVTVPAGTGLVEAAAELGVEIPVFCYEPRIGPPVGACRMCLVEIEGVPKLQAACATGVRDGMVVSTVSDRAREAQEAVLEFLLVNHPLDCPVCDKGGECPLQDQAFRWGPGVSRFDAIKRVNDKPIPVSPLIALDRERCILCYRCTRFSAEVSEDLQLIPRQRGASTVIATFEGRPYEGHHSGNVIELCPVGALTSTQYRFQARPWEAPDHPSIAGWDPVGTNISNTVREGRVVRVLARENTGVDLGWIDDRTRFSYVSMYGPARITRPQVRTNRDRPVGNRPVSEPSTEVALEWLHDKLATASSPELWLLSGTETLETVWAVQQLAAQTGGRVAAVPGASAALPQHTATIGDLADVQHVLVLGDADLLDVAPALDLWLRKAANRGASVTVAGIGGTRLEQSGAHHEFVAPGTQDAWVADFCARIAKATSDAAAEQPGIVVYRDGELSVESLELIAQTFDFPRAGSGFLAIPATSNARGLAALGVETIEWADVFAHRGGVVYMGVDPNRYVPLEQWGPSIKKAAWVVAVDTLPSPLHGAADLVFPGAAHAEQDGTLVNLEGRLQRLTVGAAAPDGVRAPTQWIAGLARRLGATVSSSAASAYRQLAAANPGNFPVATHGEITPGGVLGVAGGAPAPVRDVRDDAVSVGDGELALFVAPFLYDAPEVAYAPAMEFLRATARLMLNRTDARALGLGRGDVARIVVDGGTELEVTIATSTRLTAGHARIHAGTPGLAPGRTGWHVARIVGAVADGAAALDAAPEGAAT
ncbi:MAG: NADH-quinone oxidoreductase, chain [Thermoleophilia bacterium]|nr:NADH-quinone oxidoreductase, chain [Thermoleophilia bacterium]